mgnify:CR=1 FL=1
MSKRHSLIGLAALLFLGGCSLFRWSGYKEASPDFAGRRPASDLVISTQPAHSRPLLPVRSDALPEALYYADLGPDTIDVTGYPAQQKYNYAIYQRQCSRCHTLARSINSSHQSRIYWHLHLLRMSVRSRLGGKGRIPPGDTKAMLDFLDYDAQLRKVQNKKDFEALTEELKNRFDPILTRLLAQMNEPASTAGRAASALPQAPAERRRAALFYSDLGPDTVDVSGYPAEQQRNYEVYARACSRCHTLARSINAPYVNEAWWEFYITNMRLRSRLRGERLAPKDIRPVLDFLDFDSNERKVAHAAQFEVVKAELKRRFEAALDERVELLQKQPQPRLLP